MSSLHDLFYVTEREIWDLEKDKYHVMLAVGRTNEGLLEMHAQKVVRKIQLVFCCANAEQLVVEFCAPKVRYFLGRLIGPGSVIICSDPDLSVYSTF
jgi:hypothetical protein